MVFWKCVVISFGKARTFFEAGVTILQESRIGNRLQGGSRRPRPRTGRVNSSVLDCFFYPLGLRGDVRAAKPPAPSALTLRLAMLATAVGFRGTTPPNGINQHFPREIEATTRTPHPTYIMNHTPAGGACPLLQQTLLACAGAYVLQRGTGLLPHWHRQRHSAQWR